VRKAMTKTELVLELAEKLDINKSQASQTLETLVSIVTDEVASGRAVTLPGLGKLQTRERPERMVHNPATGQKIKKDADRVVKMTIAKALNAKVNEK